MDRILTLIMVLSLSMIIAGCASQEKNQQSTTTTTVFEEVTTLTETTTTTQQTAASTIIEEPSTAKTTTVGVPSSGASYGTTTTSTTQATTCLKDSDCPNPFNSSKYCWTGQDFWNGDEKKIYLDEVEYKCSEGGTPLARCVEVRRRINFDRCVASNCFQGDCYPTHCFNQRVDKNEEAIDCGLECPDCSLKPNITCFNDCDCLTRESQISGVYYTKCKTDQISASEFVAEGRCYDTMIFQNLVTYKCKKPGTEESYCTSNITQQMITAVCRNKNCTLDCDFKTRAYPNLAVLKDEKVVFTS